MSVDRVIGPRPTEWSDDLRMSVMFSPFRERSLNPKGWEQKVKFWSQLILKDCIECKQALVTVSDLKDKFLRKGKKPSCLQTVLQEMLGKGDIKRLADMEPKNSEGWMYWGFKKLVREPVGWSLKLLPWQGGTKPDEPEETYVIVEVIQEKGRELMEKHTSRVNKAHADIVEYSDLQKLHTDLCSNETEFSLVLQHLQSTNQIVIQEVDKEKKLVKFIHANNKDDKQTIEEKDIHIHKIQLAKESLKKQIKLMSAEVTSLGKEAMSYKAEGHRSLAISCMRKRKLVVNRIEKLTGSLDTLEVILYKISQAESNEMVLRAIEGGTTILKDLNKKTTAEEVTEIMDSLADVSQSQDELSAELGLKIGIDEPSNEELEEELNDIVVGNDGDEDRITSMDNLHSTCIGDDLNDTGDDLDELEKELANILKEDKTERKHTTNNTSLTEMLNDLQLPDVPSDSPVKDTRKKKAQVLTS